MTATVSFSNKKIDAQCIDLFLLVQIPVSCHSNDCAVTHVLVNDSTMGYGIFIENMLDAA